MICGQDMAQNMKKKFLLYDCQDLTSKLKPAFEEEEEQISDQFRRKVSKSEGTNSNSKPSEASGFATIPGNIWGDFDETEPISEDLSKLTVSSNKSCSTCGVTFDSTDEQRAHFKLDWHRFNIANKLKGNLKAITEEQFEEQLDNLSLSGSESDESETEEDILSEKTSRLPKLFMTNSDNPLQVYSIYRAILPDLKEKTTLKWAVFMLGGGHFAGAIFDNGIAILHKTFHCYTVRAKQGGSQGSAGMYKNRYKVIYFFHYLMKHVWFLYDENSYFKKIEMISFVHKSRRFFEAFFCSLHQ